MAGTFQPPEELRDGRLQERILDEHPEVSKDCLERVMEHTLCQGRLRLLEVAWRDTLRGYVRKGSYWFLGHVKPRKRRQRYPKVSARDVVHAREDAIAILTSMLSKIGSLK